MRNLGNKLKLEKPRPRVHLTAPARDKQMEICGRRAIYMAFCFFLVSCIFGESSIVFRSQIAIRKSIITVGMEKPSTSRNDGETI